MQPDLMDVVPLRVDYVEDNSPLHSFALRDIGVDTLFDLSDKETVYRVRLGDMCFVARRRPDRTTSHLYFVPEYPNNNLGLRERLTTYYALPVFGSKADLCELRVSDPSLRILDWEVGVGMAAPIHAAGSSDLNKKTIERIFEIDALVRRYRPNVSVAEMRESIGPSSGARLAMSPFLVGDIT